MAETFIAIGAAMGGGSAAAGTAATATAATTTASTISTALTIGTALASIASGFAARTESRIAATQVKTQNAQARARDSQERASMAEEYAEITADQTAVQIANGLNPGVGTPASVRSATRAVADRNLSTSRENTLNRSRVARLQQRALLSQGNAAMIRGFVGAGQAGMQGYQLTGG